MKKPLLKYKNENLYLVIANYTSNGRLYLGLKDRDGDLYSDITLNLNDIPEYDKNIIFLCNDLPNDLVNQLRDKLLIGNTIDTIYYNYGKYDAVMVSEAKLKEYDLKAYNTYKKNYDDFHKENKEINLKGGEKINEF